MLNVDDAIKHLEQSIPGLKIENYTKTGDNLFKMDLMHNGRTISCEGEITRFRTIDQMFIEKIKARLDR